MRHFTLSLKEKFPSLQTQQEPSLTAYLPDNSPEIDPNRSHPAVLICPGGGYEYCSEREAEPIALNYLPHGFAAFVLKYSVKPEGYPQQLLEVSAAAALIRQNADLWNIDPNALCVIGFSAGGHLAASLGVYWNDPFLAQSLNIPFGQNKPNALILSYSVITADKKYTHESSMLNLLAGREDPALRQKFSLETYVGPQVPPSFIWHTVNDTCVPAENSLLFAMSLSKHKIPYELHLFPDGVHGLANCNRTTASDLAAYFLNTKCEEWIQLSIKWLQSTL